VSFDWIHESPPRWDAAKAAAVGAAPPGVFAFEDYRLGDLLPGEWWRVEHEGEVAGYGWMDATWGDAEILLVVVPAWQRRGAGTFILNHLEQEARASGLNYLYNVVAPGHPEAEAVTQWLERRGFTRARDGRLVRLAAERPTR
jgi:N-acetylglutamate synthase-like GNAT family acetyltransferase